MSARGKMTMRATIERNTATETDAGGQPVAPVWTVHIPSVPCYVWHEPKRGMIDDSAKTVRIEDRRMICPVSADIHEGDRVSAVRDRSGEPLFVGPVPAAIQLVGRRKDHLAIMLEEIDGAVLVPVDNGNGNGEED